MSNTSAEKERNISEDVLIRIETVLAVKILWKLRKTNEDLRTLLETQSHSFWL
jgi:hypothetical protein